mmetsp:Transcript_62053/g.202466  ORF Transcript_62053/g.202466 Transcript_62053/m.202466 type:complete len:277 (-) Transcript_62053:2331-3161(-)
MKTRRRRWRSLASPHLRTCSRPGIVRLRTPMAVVEPRISRSSSRIWPMTRVVVIPFCRRRPSSTRPRLGSRQLRQQQFLGRSSGPSVGQPRAPAPGPRGLGCVPSGCWAPCRGGCSPGMASMVPLLMRADEHLHPRQSPQVTAATRGPLRRLRCRSASLQQPRACWIAPTKRRRTSGPCTCTCAPRASTCGRRTSPMCHKCPGTIVQGWSAQWVMYARCWNSMRRDSRGASATRVWRPIWSWTCTACCTPFTSWRFCGTSSATAARCRLCSARMPS